MIVLNQLQKLLADHTYGLQRELSIVVCEEVFNRLTKFFNQQKLLLIFLSTPKNIKNSIPNHERKSEMALHRMEKVCFMQHCPLIRRGILFLRVGHITILNFYDASFALANILNKPYLLSFTLLYQFEFAVSLQQQPQSILLLIMLLLFHFQFVQTIYPNGFKYTKMEQSVFQPIILIYMKWQLLLNLAIVNQRILEIALKVNQQLKEYHYQLMSIELLKLLEQSKAKAIGKGEIINLRKTDITKEHLVTKKVKKFDYTWYQTPSKVGIEIPYIIENKEDLKVKFQAEKVTIEFPIKNGGDYHLDLELFKTIIPERSKKNHRLDKIEIVMQKKQQNYNWLALRKDGQGIPEAKQQEQVLYPSSSKNKRNWDKIDKQIQSQIQRHGQQYGEDPSMNFFKQIFCQGDQQKRRAMIKSYQTSGGTVLSTDWADVAKKDYEGRDRPSPPKGQQWKKREI